MPNNLNGVMPRIRCYGHLERAKNSGKTPKFSITRYCGHYPPLNDLIGRDGKVSMYLMESQKSGSNEDAPPMKLQAKNSLNFTGLKDYFVKGRISGYAYGYPNASVTYRYKGKDVPNPFYAYREDGFLFLIHTDEANANVVAIEMLVLNGTRDITSAYAQGLANGGFDEELQKLRSIARVV